MTNLEFNKVGLCVKFTFFLLQAERQAQEREVSEQQRWRARLEVALEEVGWNFLILCSNLCNLRTIKLFGVQRGARISHLASLCEWVPAWGLRKMAKKCVAKKFVVDRNSCLCVLGVCHRQAFCLF